MTSTLDLRQLAVDRTSSAATKIRPRRKHLLTRYVVPLGIFLGFAAVIGWAARESFLPAKAVTVVPVVIAKAEIQQSGTPLFQAAGWIEPRPTPVVVSALAEGVVKDLLVVEGQEVSLDQPLARLVDVDANIAVSQAEADLQLKRAELASARANAVAARINLEQPVQLEAALAESEAMLAKVRTELGNLPFTVRTAESRLQLARQEFEGKKRSGDSVAGRVLQRSQSELTSAQALLDEVSARKPSLEVEVRSLEARRNALAKQLRLKTNETRQLAEAEASVEAASARVQKAILEVQTARLRLDRMTIKAPSAGRVLFVNARPGKRLMGLDPASETDATTVLSLYDPQQLQVRADVRLEDVPNVYLGAPAQIQTVAASEPLEGEVTGITSSADIQKNTLQVKVAIKAPPPVIRPEMLAQVTFLAPEKAQSPVDESEEPMRTLVPRELVISDDTGTFVWIADRTNGVARRHAVRLGKAGTDLLVEIAEGITAMDKLIVGGRESLEDGTRIYITGDATSFSTTRLPTSVASNNTSSKL